MKYLLDTHTFLWSLVNTKELSGDAIKVIKNSDNEIYVSSISLWEIAIKTRLGKLYIEGIDIDELPGVIDKQQFCILSLTAEDAIGYYSLKEDTHKDPFDRMLFYQSISRNMTIISKDSAFSKFVPFGLKLMW